MVEKIQEFEYENCRNCIFSREMKVDASLQRKRQCRVNPPQLLMLPTQQGMMMISDFPSVTDDMWCSKFTM